MIIVANSRSIFTFVSLQRMLEKTFSKKLMLTAGILAALVILCSQAFQKETSTFLSKIKTDKAEKPSEAEKRIIIATPADAVTSSPAVEVGDANPSFIREIIFNEDRTHQQPTIDSELVSNFFKTLFSLIISPQAP